MEPRPRRHHAFDPNSVHPRDVSLGHRRCRFLSRPVLTTDRDIDRSKRLKLAHQPFFPPGLSPLASRPSPLAAPTMAPSFAGRVVVQRRHEAIEEARDAALARSAPHHIEPSLFCDASRALESDRGGIGVAYKPWLPRTFSRDERRFIIEAAYLLASLLSSCPAFPSATTRRSSVREPPFSLRASHTPTRSGSDYVKETMEGAGGAKAGATAGGTVHGYYQTTGITVTNVNRGSLNEGRCKGSQDRHCDSTPLHPGRRTGGETPTSDQSSA
jgi:hypothetical protein